MKPRGLVIIVRREDFLVFTPPEVPLTRILVKFPKAGWLCYRGQNEGCKVEAWGLGIVGVLPAVLPSHVA
jgi:hypothetical protein